MVFMLCHVKMSFQLTFRWSQLNSEEVAFAKLDVIYGAILTRKNCTHEETKWRTRPNIHCTDAGGPILVQFILLRRETLADGTYKLK